MSRDRELEEAAEILRTRFRMNRYQSKAYLAALRGHHSAKDISRRTGIPISRVYDVLDSLEEAGLVRRSEDGYVAAEPSLALRNRLERLREMFERDHLERLRGLERFLRIVQSHVRRYAREPDSAVIRGLESVVVKMVEACLHAEELVFMVRKAVKLKEEFKRVLETLPRKKILLLIHPSIELDNGDLEFLSRIGAKISRSSAVLLDMLVTDRGEVLIGLPLDEEEPIVIWVKHEGFANSLYRAVLEEAGL
ncbi:MAG: helix-turn-helix domain-containing protein [Nitrososphaerota archaeon]